MSNQPLRQLAEEFRLRATVVEAKHGKRTWTQTINVIEAFEQCAAELEAFAEILETPPPALPPNLPAQTSTNPS